MDCWTCGRLKKESYDYFCETLECLQQGFVVWLPFAHVCANLGDLSAEGGSRLSAFFE